MPKRNEHYFMPYKLFVKKQKHRKNIVLKISLREAEFYDRGKGKQASRWDKIHKQRPPLKSNNHGANSSKNETHYLAGLRRRNREGGSLEISFTARGKKNVRRRTNTIRGYLADEYTHRLQQLRFEDLRVGPRVLFKGAAGANPLPQPGGGGDNGWIYSPLPPPSPPGRVLGWEWGWGVVQKPIRTEGGFPPSPPRVSNHPNLPCPV